MRGFYRNPLILIYAVEIWVKRSEHVGKSELLKSASPCVVALVEFMLGPLGRTYERRSCLDKNLGEANQKI